MPKDNDIVNAVRELTLQLQSAQERMSWDVAVHPNQIARAREVRRIATDLESELMKLHPQDPPRDDGKAPGGLERP